MKSETETQAVWPTKIKTSLAKAFVDSRENKCQACCLQALQTPASISPRSALAGHPACSKGARKTVSYVSVSEASLHQKTWDVSHEAKKQ